MQVSVIGGAIDSGKTSIILRLSRYLKHQGKHIGVIIQENGKVDYDEQTLKSLGIETKEIDSVCIPCSLDTDIRNNLMNLKEDPGPDVVFIEAEETIIPDKIRVDIERMGLQDIEFLPVVVVIDATDYETEAEQLTEYARRQLVGADIVCINKTDIADQAMIESIEELARQLNPEARIIRTSAIRDSGDLWELLA